ncbi:Cytochrome P450 6a19 [Carabus blaptoides fortunei]
MGVPHLKPSFPFGNFDSQFTKFLGQRDVNTKSVELTVDQIAAHCFSFFITAFEMTAWTIVMCMYELAVNTNIQDKVRVEIASVLKKYNGDITCDAITELRYLDQVIYDQIAAHCFLFFFVGFESPAATINFCMFELAVNPNIQDKVRAEITSVLEKYNGHMTYDAISELRYLDQVFNGMKFGIVESKIAISRMIKDFKFFLHPKIKLPLKLRSVGPIVSLDEPILLLTEKI